MGDILIDIRLVAFMSGLAHVTLPFPTSKNSSLDEAWILGGANGLVVAADIKGSGHATTFPSDEPTVILQITFDSLEDMPMHEVVTQGPCHFHSIGDQLV